MKKKIIFMLINMNVGGTEKALLNMISEMPEEQYDITILLLENYGGFMDLIPKHVHVEYLQGYNKIKDLINQPLQVNALRSFRKGNFIKALILIFIWLLTKTRNERTMLFRYVLKDIHTTKNDYDVAVAYAGPMDFISYYIINRVNAKKKFQWIHFDITKIGFNRTFAKKVYEKFDRINVVSEEAKTKLIKTIPSLIPKTSVFLNIVSSKSIRDQATKGKGFNDDFKGLRILTVGRLSEEKGQDLAILALKKLIQDGFNVRWYCVGEGKARKDFEKLAFDNNLEENFIFLGADTNPYSYLQQCDIYVQPSRYEGYCMTILEAKHFYRPIVATRVNGVMEQLKDGETGIVVNIDENEIYLAIKELINNKGLRNAFSTNLAEENKTQRDFFNLLDC